MTELAPQRHDASVTLTQSESIATIVLDRPERNAMTVGMMHTLTAMLMTLEADSAPVCVLRGANGALSTGRDHSEQVEPAARVAAIVELYKAIRQFSGLYVVQAEGRSLGLAGALCALADICVADPETTFAFDEIQHGLPPFLAMAHLRDSLREKDLRRLVVTGQEVAADEALRIGLVTEIQPKDLLPSRVTAIARGAVVDGRHIRTCKRFLSETRGLGSDEVQSLAELRMAAY